MKAIGLSGFFNALQKDSLFFMLLPESQILRIIGFHGL